MGLFKHTSHRQKAITGYFKHSFMLLALSDTEWATLSQASGIQVEIKALSYAMNPVKPE